MTTTRKAIAQKTVTIIARIQFKNDSRKVCYLVRSSSGKDTYTTCLFNGKATSCTCPARKPCYHMTQLETIEAARPQVAAEAEVVEIPAEVNRYGGIAARGTLNNSNRGFSLMR